MTERHSPSILDIVQARTIQRTAGNMTLVLLGSGAANVYAGVRYGDTALGMLGLTLITFAGMEFAVCDEATTFADSQLDANNIIAAMGTDKQTEAALEVWGITRSEQTPLGKQ